MRSREQKKLCNTLHFYHEISTLKESCANFSGDGPNVNEKNKAAEELKNLNILAMIRNGVNISRARENCPFKIVSINNVVFQFTKLNNNSHEIGDIVTLINEFDLRLYNNISVAKLLSTTNISSIVIHTPNEYRKLKKITVENSNAITTSIKNNNSNSPTLSTILNVSNNYITSPITTSTYMMNDMSTTLINSSNSNSTISIPLNGPNSTLTSPITNSTNMHNITPAAYEIRHLNMLALNLNGLSITKEHRYSSFKIQEINMAVLATRVSNTLSIGDIVLEINDILLHIHDNLFAAHLLSSEILISIRSYTPRRSGTESTTTMTYVNNNSRTIAALSSASSTNNSSEEALIINRNNSYNIIHYNNSTNNTALSSPTSTNNSSNQSLLPIRNNLYYSSQSSKTPIRSNLNMHINSETQMQSSSLRQNIYNFDITHEEAIAKHFKCIDFDIIIDDTGGTPRLNITIGATTQYLDPLYNHSNDHQKLQNKFQYNF